MAFLTVSNVGNALYDMLSAPDIIPGAPPSYQLCKNIYLFHPLGYKMTTTPVNMAQSQKREIAVANSPGTRVVDRFNEIWDEIGADAVINNVASLARTYGVATLALGIEGVDPGKPLDINVIGKKPLYLQAYDPLNTAGSLVGNLNPTSPNFLKYDHGVSVQGDDYHRSRCCIVMNEAPIYLAYTTSSFGYVGRSVYQRALFPLKSFIQTMITDDWVSLKCGVLIAKQRQPGSIIDNIMAMIGGIKRSMLQMSATWNVLSIAPDEDISSLNLQNLDGAGTFARNNILKNIATAADMPAMLLNEETFVEGFGEGTEDANRVMQYINRIRTWLLPLYRFMDVIVQRLAWTEEFVAAIQNEFPDEYGGMSFNEVFYKWKNSFSASWPELQREPESKQLEGEDVKLKALIAALEVLLPIMDPENKATIIQWACDNWNHLERVFPAPLVLEIDTLLKHYEQVAEDQKALAAAGAAAAGGGEEKDEATSESQQAKALPKPPAPFRSAA
jgi:hypothetical protein